MKYAYRQEDTLEILKPIVFTLFMQAARQYNLLYHKKKPKKLSDAIVSYIGEDFDSATLIILEQRMERAESLLKATTLSIEDISYMLSYSNPSNFYHFFEGNHNSSTP